MRIFTEFCSSVYPISTLIDFILLRLLSSTLVTITGEEAVEWQCFQNKHVQIEQLSRALSAYMSITQALYLIRSTLLHFQAQGWQSRERY